MKTPREILLQKHRAMEPKLDAIRDEVLKQELRPPVACVASGGRSPSFLSQLWMHLVLPSRRIWAGLAMLWLVVIGLSIATPDVPRSNYASTVVPPNTPERELALQQQQRLLADLLNGNGRIEARVRPYVPRPSSRTIRSIRSA